MKPLLRKLKPSQARLSTALGYSTLGLSTVLFAADEAAAEGGGSMAPYLSQTVWAIISFLVVLGIIWIKLFPMIQAGLDKRAAEIREALDSAAKARSEAEEAMKRHQDDLEKARQEARAIIDEGKADAERVKDKIVNDARQEAEEVSSRAKREIELAKQSALSDLHQQSVQLSLDLAGRLIGKSLQQADHEKLIQDCIQGFESKN